MWEAIKALFLLIAGIVAIVATYVGWLMYMPVTTTDISARIWNACVVGQVLFQYGKPTHTSCDCFVDGLQITKETSATISEQAEMLRQVAVARFSPFGTGSRERQSGPQFNPAAYGKATPLANRLVSLDKACTVRRAKA
jgi:hypothetical protein